MRKFEIKAPAKLNLSLNVFPKKLPSGLFPVKFLNCQAGLCDKVILKEKKSGIVVDCDDPAVPKGEENLAFKAVKLLKKKAGDKKGIEIFIEKHISVTGGLGGGSTDAAAVLLGLNKLWNLGLSEEELLEIATQLGMDVCYLVIGGTCLIKGAGGKVKRLPFSVPKMPVIIVSPEERKPSTAWAYQNINLDKIGKAERKLERLIEAIKKKDLEAIGKNLHNDFEYSIPAAYKEVGLIKKIMLETGALGSILAGSGLSVFGVYKNEQIAKKAYNVLKNQLSQVFLTKII